MLRWAILGTGFISNTVAAAIHASPGSELVAVVGRDPSRTQAFAASHGAANWTTSLDTLLTRTGLTETGLSETDVDAVYIATPNHAHHEPVARCVAAGKAVLSEKSLTRTMATAHELIASVEASDSFFVEGLMYLAHPLYQTVVELLTDGRLGELRAVTGYYAADIADKANPAGGGTIYNLGCYPVSLLQLVVQTMCGPEAFSKRTISGHGSQDSHGNVIDAALSVRFDNGVLATLQSTDSYGMSHGFEVIAQHGVLRWETNPWLPDVTNRLQWQPHEQPQDQPDHAVPAEAIVVAGTDPFVHQIQLVEDAVAAGHRQASRPSPRWSDSLEIMDLLTTWETTCLATPTP